MQTSDDTSGLTVRESSYGISDLRVDEHAKDALFNEKWLHERLAEDPSLLGLGDLIVKDVERPQPHAGRLALLLVNPETATRFEVKYNSVLARPYLADLRLSA